MKLFRKAAVAGDAPATDEPIRPPAEGWTAGRALRSRVLSIVLISSLACGPIAVMIAMTPREAVVVESGEEALTPEQQHAGAYASAFVGAWFSATRSDTSQLATFIQVDGATTFSDVATNYRDLSAASVTPGTGGMVSVLVTAWVEEITQLEDDGESESAWVLRGYQVPVAVVDGGLAVSGYPSPVTLDAAESSTISLDYAVRISNNTPLWDSASDFLAAYLTGDGDITRFTTPGTSIVATSPAPYQGVEITAMEASTELPETLVDGARIATRITATATAVAGRAEPVSYYLTMTARADRWEISAIDAQPQIP